MLASHALIRLSLTVSLFFLACSVAHGQITTVTDTTSTPVPGVGHDYIHLLSETVNPANGSVSLRIQVPMPKGRGITVPFAFGYDSNGVHHLTPSFFSGDGSYDSGVWAVASWASNNDSFAQGGWSYVYPSLRLNSWTQDNYVVTGVNNGNPVYTDYPCFESSNYLFTDGAGGTHELGLGSQTSPMPPTGGCPDTPGPSSIGGDVEVSATLNNGTSSVLPVTVYDKSGTVYYFPSLPGSNSSGSTISGLPTYIEDRNGNRVTTTQNRNTSFTFTDTLGRTAISVNAFGPSGATNTVYAGGLAYQVTWKTVTASYPVPSTTIYNFAGECSAPSNVNNSYVVVSQITLPNGQSFHFYYGDNPNPAFQNPYGLLSEIDYPSGAWVKYTWNMSGNNNEVAVYPAPMSPKPLMDGCIYQYQTPVVTSRQVGYGGTSSPALTQTFQYYTYWDSSQSRWTSKTTSVTSTDNIRNLSALTAYAYSPVDQSIAPFTYTDMPAQIPLEKTITYYAGGDATTPILRTVNKVWADLTELKCETDTLDNGKTSGHAYAYNYGQIADQQDFDFGQITTPGVCPTAGSRRTHTNFQSFTGPAAIASGLTFGRPSAAMTYDGAGNTVAETDYTYDETAVSPLTGTTGHDEANYGASFNTRGNLTTIRRKCFVGATNCADSVTKNTYDETGQVTTMTDPNGNPTQYFYADSYATGSQTCSSVNGTYGNTNALLTKVIYPPTSGVVHSECFSYDFNSGQLTGLKDQNSQLTTYAYNDPLYRPTLAQLPDGGQTAIAYNDTPPSPSVTTTKKINSSQSLTSFSIMDGVGHVVETLLTSDPDCPSGDRTDTTYDGSGHAYTVSNPYCGSSSALTTYTYDALGRTIQVTHPDGSAIHTSYTGRATQVQDEGNGTQPVVRISQIDGLGRLAAVCEISNVTLPVGQGAAPVNCNSDLGGTGFLTTYAYDTLDNLRQVNQGTMTPRTFTYDSLARLLCASNPENSSAACPTTATSTYTAGTTGYTYDANGNLTTKTSPAPNQTSTATVVASYTYDALNRLTQKSYSDGTTPTATYYYDQAAPWGWNLSNYIGRLTTEWTSPSAGMQTANLYNYDPMGRVSLREQCQPQNCSADPSLYVQYSYNLLGAPTSLQMAQSPSFNVTFTYNYSSVARLTSLTSSLSDSNHPATLLTSATYTPFGSPATMQLGNGVTEARGYNSRLWLQSLTATDPVGGTATPGTGTVTISGSDQSTSIPATAGKGSATATGSEQTTIVGAAPGSTTLTLNGAEKSIVLDPCAPCEPMGCPACPTTTYDSGYVTVKVNGFTATAYYGRGDTANSVASSLAVALNTSSSPVTAVTTGSAGVKMTAKSVGTSTNYSFTTTRVTYDPTDFAGASSFWITPTSGALTGGSNGTTVYDAGTVSLIVNGVTASASYGQGDTTATVTSKLQSAAGSLPVTVSLSGSALTLTAKTTGAGTNYSLAKSCSTSKSTYFSQASFCLNLSGSALTGGANAQPLYDTGTVSITVFGYTASYSYGQNDTPSTIAAGLASALSPSAVNGSASGAIVTLTAKTTGLATNYAFSDSDTYNTAHFSSPSFTASPSGSALTGGTNDNVYSLAMSSYAPNGDILAANDSVNGSWTYSYDAFNRLTGSNQNSGQFIYSYVYDAYGNRWQQNGLIHPPANCCSFTGNGTVNNNRIDGYSYDASGNLLNDGAHNYTYDAENRLTSVDGGSTAAYLYNPEGQRVVKTAGGASNDYLYDLAGNVITELSATGVWNRGEIYAGGRHLATYNLGTTYFNHADWLGTERVRSTVAGTVYETCTSLPFGDALSCSAPDASPLHFTGKERDAESGLDNFGARYDASSLGRFMTVDPKHVSAHLSDPQSFNRYVYARNNPLLYVDPNGKDFEKAWQDFKTFVSSVYIKVSGGVGVEAKGTAGQFTGTVGGAMRMNAQTDLSSNHDGTATLVKTSISKEIGASIEAGGFKKGESVSLDQTLVTVHDNLSVDTRSEVAKPDIVDSLGGTSTVSTSSDQIGVGVEIGIGLVAGGEVGTTPEGLSALKGVFTELKDSLTNPGPPPPPPPSTSSSCMQNGNQGPCPN